VDAPPPLTIALTKEQQPQVLAATGLRVSSLELPVEVMEHGEEALARLPLPEGLKQRVSSPEGETMKEEVKNEGTAGSRLLSRQDSRNEEQQGESSTSQQRASDRRSPNHE
jgi:hypothetical protein